MVVVGDMVLVMMMVRWVVMVEVVMVGGMRHGASGGGKNEDRVALDPLEPEWER